MLYFFQKYLCFGNSKQRSSSVQFPEKRKQTDRYICEKCRKEFSMRNLYDVHKETYCPYNNSGKGFDNSVKRKDNKSQTVPQNRAKEQDRDVKQSMNKSTMSRSQIYKQDLDKSEFVQSPESSSKIGTPKARGSQKAGSGSLEPIMVPHKDFNASKDIIGSREIKNHDKRSPSGLVAQSILSITIDPFEKMIADLTEMLIQERRPLELKFIEDNIEKKSLTKYIIADAWILKYTEYLNGQTKQFPGPITNQEVYQKAISKRLPNNVYTVNDTVWKFMYKLYGGGPEVPQASRSVSISASDSDKFSEPLTADTMSATGINDSIRTQMVESIKLSRNSNFYLKPIGMTNESFYCYLNSCIQGILSIKELAYYTAQEKYRMAVKTKNHRFWKGMNEIVIAHGKKGSECTPKLIRKIAMNTFDPDEQHDAHEFLRFLLSGMQDEINLARPKKEVELTDPDTAWAYYRNYNVSVIDELFAGQLVNKVTCTSCSHVSTTFDPFLDLSLPITPGKTKTLDDCLAAFQQEEEIKDSYVCEKCKSKSRAIKRLAVSKFPKYLVIHLKRFQTYPRKKKITEPISFSLDNWNIKKVDGKETHAYSLIGSIVHRGSFDSGHYICYSKRGGEWNLCDDEDTRTVSSKEVANKEAYVLIYEKKN